MYIELKQYTQIFKLKDLMYEEDLHYRREPMVAEAMANSSMNNTSRLEDMLWDPL